MLKLAHEIFYTNHKKNFSLEHAWKELKNDQKWCELASAKKVGSSKKKCEDGADSSSSRATETVRPPGVKAVKAAGKKTVVEDNSLKKFKTMWTIKQHDLAMKERLSKMSLLDNLIAKKNLWLIIKKPSRRSSSMTCCLISLSVSVSSAL